MVEILDQAVSVRQILSYRTCQARAFAIETGQYQPEIKHREDLMKSFIGAALAGDSAFKRFKEEYKMEIYSSKKPNGLLKDFQIAESIVNVIKEDEFLSNAFFGEFNVHVSGKIGRAVVESEISYLNAKKGLIIDLALLTGLFNKKFNQELNMEVYQVVDDIVNEYAMIAWVNGYLAKTTFNVEFYNYILALSKEMIPEKELISISPNLLAESKEKFLEILDTYIKITNGVIDPIACGHCDYCKANKKIQHSVSVEHLLGWE
ncbi:TPA: PD-(D/E)XK nuclease-like domain-containing protein [Streptococcus agalactiae]